MRKTVFLNLKIVYDTGKQSINLNAETYRKLKPFLIFSRVINNKNYEH